MATSAAMRGAWERLHVAETGTGPPVLLVHGQPGVGADWEPVIERLRADHRVLAPDRPGYGASAPLALSMAENAEILSELLGAGDGGPAVVVGHSYGGGIAALLAARHPELVRGLVLVGSVGNAASVNGFDHVLALPVIGEVFSAVGLVTLGHVLPRLRPLARFLPEHAGTRLRASLPDLRYAAGVSRLGLRMCRTFVAEQRSLIAEIAEVEAAIAALDLPVSVITGTWDTVVPPSVAVSIARSVPGAELVAVAGVGHFVPRDQPSAVASAVRRVEARAAH